MKIEQRRISKENIQTSRIARYDFTCWRPGGNDTALILGEPPLDRKSINDEIMKQYPNQIEQVGFVYVDESGTVNLQMAGGEFCGNATRSAAYMALEGKPGIIPIKVSGVKDLLVAGVTENGEAFAQMPVYPDIDKIKFVQDDYIVEMEGITHRVTFKNPKTSSPEDLKKLSLQILKENGLDKGLASGVIWVSEENGQFRIDPVVYVRNIDTCFYETACGSGTTALGQVLALKSGSSIKEISILQPSGEVIKVSIELGLGGFSSARIQGQVKQLTEGTLVLEKNRDPYRIESVLTSEQLDFYFAQKGLGQLYAEVFGNNPYWEYFSPAEIKIFFEEYLTQGIILLALDESNLLAFTSAIPLANEPSLLSIAQQAGIPIDNSTYIAELGVRAESRKKRIGLTLMEELLTRLPTNMNAFLRTVKGNEPAIKLYQGLGFEIIPGLEQNVTRPRTNLSVSQTDTRIFMIRSI